MHYYLGRLKSQCTCTKYKYIALPTTLFGSENSDLVVHNEQGYLYC